MKRTMMFAIATLFALAAWAGQTALFDRYEGVRQALLKGSVSDVQRTAKDLATAAQKEKQSAVVQSAQQLSAAPTLKAARDSFAALSEQMIRFRDAQSGDRPSVVYCAMEKKCWLQPKGPIGNPYVDAGMRGCGEVKR